MKSLHRNVHRSTVTLIGTALASTFLMGTAWAQDSVPGEVAAEAAEDSGDGIVVTARRREESLLEVPIAVSAVTGQAMKDHQIQDITDIADFVPGLQISEAFGRSADRPVIRGASNLLMAEGKVGVFIDGTPFFGDFTSLDLANVERVEVIRGPQSAVFGRGTLAGAINVVLSRPGQELAGKASVTVGNYNRRELSGSISAPILPWLGVQAGVKIFDVDGQYTNRAVAGERLGGQNSKQYTVGLFADPSPDFSASVRWMHQRDADEHYVIGLLPASQNNCYLSTRTYQCGELQSPKAYGLNTDRLQRPGIHRNADRFLGDARWDIAGSGYELSFQGGMNDLFEVIGTDQSFDGREFYLFGSPATCAFIPIPNQLCSQSTFNTTTSTRRKTQTYELRLSSPGKQRFRWRVGAYGARDTLTPTTDYIEASESGLDLLGDKRRIETKAVFGGFDFDITDTLTLGAEIRHQNDKVRATTLTYRAGDVLSPEYLAQLGQSNPNQIVGTPALREATFKAWLPRATITWEVQPQLSIYAQYAQGNAPGGFNPLGAPSSTFDEEKLTNYEIGLRTTRWGFKYLSLALFNQIYDNQVLTNTYQTATTINSYQVNIGRTRSRGLELEGTYPVAGPLLEVQFSYALIDSKIRKGIDPEMALLRLGAACKTGSATNLALPGCTAAASIVGHRPPLVSRHTGSIGVRSRHDVGNDWEVFAGADLIYRSSFFDQVYNLAESGDSIRVNAQIGVEARNGLRIALWGRNLFNNDTPVGILRYLDFLAPRAPTGDRARAFAITPPRKPEFGLTASYDF